MWSIEEIKPRPAKEAHRKPETVLKTKRQWKEILPLSFYF